ncbi:MAG: amino acid racemase [Patescibacteria group bacterium]
MKKHQNQHRIGILGGLGPDTTAHFYLDLIKGSTREARPDLFIASLPLNLQKEAEYIATGIHRDHYLQLLRDGVHALVGAGCTEIVMPCNTVHEFHTALLEEVAIPFPNLIEVVVEELKRRMWTRVLLLATSRTVATNLYQNAVSGSAIEFVPPIEQDQRRLDLLIQGLLGNSADETHQAFLAELMEKAGTESVLLGCTDLQLIISPSKSVVDSMKCLVNHTVNILLSSY